MSQKRIIILTTLFFFKVDWDQSYTAQPRKTLNWRGWEVDHLGSEPGWDVLLKSCVFFCLISSRIYEGRATIKLYFPGHSLKHPHHGSANCLWVLFVAASTWALRFCRGSLLAPRPSLTVTQSWRLIEWTSLGQHSFPRKSVYLLTKEKWTSSFKHVSQKPLNDFYKTQTIGANPRSK